ncbi:hypothetical protein TWF281_007487 [Arthrobotrys megalospora]
MAARRNNGHPASENFERLSPSPPLSTRLSPPVGFPARARARKSAPPAPFTLRSPQMGTNESGSSPHVQWGEQKSHVYPAIDTFGSHSSIPILKYTDEQRGIGDSRISSTSAKDPGAKIPRRNKLVRQSLFVESSLRGVEKWLRDHEDELSEVEMKALTSNIEYPGNEDERPSNIETFLNCALQLYRLGFTADRKVVRPEDIEAGFSRMVVHLQPSDTPVRKALLQRISNENPEGHGAFGHGLGGFSQPLQTPESLFGQSTKGNGFFGQSTSNDGVAFSKSRKEFFGNKTADWGVSEQNTKIHGGLFGESTSNQGSFASENPWHRLAWGADVKEPLPESPNKFDAGKPIKAPYSATYDSLELRKGDVSNDAQASQRKSARLLDPQVSTSGKSLKEKKLDYREITPNQRHEGAEEVTSEYLTEPKRQTSRSSVGAQNPTQPQNDSTIASTSTTAFKTTTLQDGNETKRACAQKKEESAQVISPKASTFVESGPGNPKQQDNDVSGDSSTTDTSHNSYHEFRGTLSSGILYLMYLAVAHGRGLNRLQDSDRSWNSAGDSMGSSGSDGVDGTGNCSSRDSSSEPKSGDLRNKAINSKKHSREDESNKDGSAPPPQRPRYETESNRLPWKQLACPYGKGNPLLYSKCVLKNRRDLSGVKEHLKRNHFGGTLPPELKTARTWSGLFQICNPDWPSGTEIPSPYFDPYEVYLSHHERTVESHLSIADTRRSERDQSNASPAPGRHLQPNVREHALNVSGPSAALPPQNRTSSGSNQNESTENSSNAQAGTAIHGYSLQDRSLENLFPDALLNAIDGGLTPTLVEELFRSVVPSIDDNLDLDLDVEGGSNPGAGLLTLPDEFFDLSSYPGSLNTPTSTAELTPSSGTASWSSATGKGPANLTSLSTDENFSLDISPGLAQHQDSILSRQRAELNDNQSSQRKIKKYLLCITRNPALSKPFSSEGSGIKKFFFDDLNEFRVNFDVWMKNQFYDPAFCWGFWEIENPLTKQRFTNTEAVVENLEFTWLAYRSTEAAFYLVPKQIEVEM